MGVESIFDRVSVATPIGGSGLGYPISSLIQYLNIQQQAYYKRQIAARILQGLSTSVHTGFNLGVPPDHDPTYKFVSNQSDPAYKSYNDSLSLYNNSKMLWDMLAQREYNNNLENYNRLMSRDWITNQEKEAFKKPSYNYYGSNMKPMNEYGNYSAVVPGDIGDDNIKPIGFSPGMRGHGNTGTFIYKKPTVPVFVEGTELANNAEKQIMLQKAGLYTGKIDGIWGDKSKAAMQEYERQQQNITQSQPTNQVVAPTTQQPTMEAKPAVPKVVSGISKNYGSYTSTSGKSPNTKEFNSSGSSTNSKGSYYTVRYTDGTTETLTPSEYEQYKQAAGNITNN